MFVLAAAVVGAVCGHRGGGGNPRGGGGYRMAAGTAPAPPAVGMLRAEVTDDGAGGADPAAGTGLAGVERRLATFDGILAVSSPPGGPTIVVIEVPCASSSAKTSSC
jgi:hypothetical protein